ncbi:SHOCT domain-containing protein, partial [Zoogloea sp.]|uniref:SHOCT domain-containing protein n=1 Tax=Zoogloea sp. TaxID=49181 RepID=UPI0014169329
VMMDALRGSQAPAAPAAAPVPAAAPAADDHEARLAKLKSLLDKGLVTQADYDSAKAEILKKLIG